MADPVEVTEDDVAALLEMDDDEFAEVVGEALNGGEDWPCLIHEGVVGRTVTTLGDMVAAVQSALDRLHAEESTQDSRRRIAVLYGRRRVLDARLKQANQVNEKLKRARRRAHVKTFEAAVAERVARQQAHGERMTEHAGAHRVAAAQLALAVHRHRLSSVESGLDAEAHDRALWRALDEVLVPLDGGMVPVNEVIGRGLWKEQSGG